MSAISNSSIAHRVSKIPPSYFVFTILLVILWVCRPQMLNVNVLGIFIRQVVPLGILVLGQLLVMRVKSIDLSGGGVILLINYVMSSGTFPPRLVFTLPSRSPPVWSSECSMASWLPNGVFPPSS